MPSVLQVVEAAERVDPEGARELVRLALYETLVDVVKGYGLDEAALAEAADNNDAVRRGLVRKFIDARLSQAPVEPLIEAALQVVAVDAVVAKADSSYLQQHNEKQGKNGRFMRLYGNANQTLDMVNRMTTQPPASQLKGRGAEFASSGPYDQARMLGRALTQVNNPNVAAAGVALDVAGQLGPEAEAVFGNHLKRAAYRYRGTEKNPSSELVHDVHNANVLAAQLTSPDPQHKAEGSKNLNQYASTQPGREPRQRPVNVSLAEYNVSRRGSKYGGSRDAVLQATQADAATAYLLKHIPKMANVNLSMTAGKVPPSKGVIIDREGNVTTEAMGYNGDHYLPFDLKNLSALHGGQYVRTRAIGGPTTEDIYTGLLSGARQMTVVSNNGVFTMEFDPDLRGGRRYNDKAHQMVGRYQQLLQVIADKQVTVGSLKPEELQALRNKALEDAPQDNPAEARALYERYKSVAEQRALFEHEDEDVHEQAHQMALAEAQDAMQRGLKTGQYSTASIARRTQDFEGELRQQAAANRFQQVRLDGPGYYRAMLALQEEFPYYIRRADYVPLEQWQRDRGLANPKSGEPLRYGERGVDSAHVGPDMLSFKNPTYKARAEERAKAKAKEDGEKAEGAAPSTPGIRKPSAAAKGPEFGSERALPYEKAEKADLVGRTLYEHGDLFIDDENMRTRDLTSSRDAAQMVAWSIYHGNTIGTEFAKLDKADQDRLLKMCYAPAAASATHGNEGAAEDALHELGDTLKIIVPFGQALNDQTAMEKFDEHSRPLDVPAVTSIGANAQALRLWPDSQVGSQRAKIAEFAELGPGDAADRIAKYQGAVKRARDDQEDMAPALKDLHEAHIAYTYHHALSLAEEAPSPKTAAPRRAGPNGTLVLPTQERQPQGVEKSDAWQQLRDALSRLRST